MTRAGLFLIRFLYKSTIVWLGLIAVTMGGPVFAGEASTAASVYDVRGVLKSIDLENHQATITHEAVPGYMAAMTMGFAIRHSSGLQELRPGDLITFRLFVTRNDAWIEQVRKIGMAAVPPFTPAPATVTRELAPGDVMPDIELIDEHDNKFKLSDLRGNVVAFTFIYTHCPLPTYCPRIEGNFLSAQELMKRLDTGDKWRLISITIDPANDTPDVLASTASNFDADTTHWIFATGDARKIATFGSGVGLQFTTTSGQISHNLRAVVLDSSGHIEHIFRGNSWTPQELASEMRTAMQLRQ